MHKSIGEAHRRLSQSSHDLHSFNSSGKENGCDEVTGLVPGTFPNDSGYKESSTSQEMFISCHNLRSFSDIHFKSRSLLTSSSEWNSFQSEQNLANVLYGECTMHP